jgi:hypothetical protein
MPEHDVDTLKFDHGVIAHIRQDDDPQNPRENDNPGVMVCWHRRYRLGDKHDFKSPREMLCHLAGVDSDDERPQNELWELAEARGYVILPLYLYDHSGLTMSTSPFSCPWDSGQVGYIYAGPEEMKRMGVKPENLKEALEGDVLEYDRYLRGDVYVVSIETPDDPHADDCCGVFGLDYAREEATAIAAHYVKKYGDPARLAGAGI